MGEAAIPEPKAGDENKEGIPSLLTVKDCLWRFMPAAMFLVPGVIVSFVGRDIFPLILTAPFWLRDAISSSFLLYHVRRGKRLVNPWTVPLNKRPLCSTQRFTDRIDAVTTTLLWAGWIVYMAQAFLHAPSLKQGIFSVIMLCVFTLGIIFDWRRVLRAERQARRDAIPLQEAVQLPEMITATETPTAWWTANATQEETNSVRQRRQ